MEKDPGIYEREPSGKRADKETAPASVLRDERLQMWRTFVLFILLMLGLLGITSYFLYLQDAEEELQITLAPAIMDPDANGPVTNQVRDRESIFRINEPLFNFDEDLTAEIVADPTADVDPDKIVEAMREVRTATEYLREREFDMAEMHARKALQIWPDMNIAFRLLGVVYFHRGRFDDSIVFLERALEGNPFSPEIFNNMGLAYLQKGELGRSSDLLETALDLDPDYYITSLNLGFLYLAMKRYDLAAEYIEYGLDKMPENVNARNNLAVALLRLNRFEESREHLQNLIDQAPGVSFPFFTMAITYVLERDFDTAMQWIVEGANVCSLQELQEFLADPDFDDIRSHPPFMEFIDEKFAPPGA